MARLTLRILRTLYQGMSPGEHRYLDRLVRISSTGKEGKELHVLLSILRDLRKKHVRAWMHRNSPPTRLQIKRRLFNLMLLTLIHVRGQRDPLFSSGLLLMAIHALLSRGLHQPARLLIDRLSELLRRYPLYWIRLYQEMLQLVHDVSLDSGNGDVFHTYERMLSEIQLSTWMRQINELVQKWGSGFTEEIRSELNRIYEQAHNQFQSLSSPGIWEEIAYLWLSSRIHAIHRRYQEARDALEALLRKEQERPFLRMSFPLLYHRILRRLTALTFVMEDFSATKDYLKLWKNELRKQVLPRDVRTEILLEQMFLEMTIAIHLHDFTTPIRISSEALKFTSRQWQDTHPRILELLVMILYASAYALAGTGKTDKALSILQNILDRFSVLVSRGIRLDLLCASILLYFLILLSLRRKWVLRQEAERWLQRFEKIRKPLKSEQAIFQLVQDFIQGKLLPIQWKERLSSLADQIQKWVEQEPEENVLTQYMDVVAILRAMAENQSLREYYQTRSPKKSEKEQVLYPFRDSG